MPLGAQPRPRHAVRMVAQPLHGLRPPLHVLLRPRVRGAGRPPRRRRGTGRSIRVKTNIAAVLRRELARPSWQRESVAIGAATDPYQPAEGRYRLTRACIVELAAAATPFSLITRGPLVWRDVDVLQDASRRAQVSVSVSVPTVDDDVWRTTEPGTAPPRQRLEAVRRFPKRASTSRSRWRRSSPACPIGPSSSKRSCAPHARRARTASGPTSST